MRNRLFLLFLACVLRSSGLLADERPNIVFFFTDDALRDALIAKADEGLTIQGVWDLLGASNQYSEDETLCEAGIPIKIEDFGGSVDNPDLATLDGSPSYLIFGLNSKYSVNKNWRLDLGINNITDRHYRSFSSGVSAAGRHIFISIQYQWEN